MPNVTAIILNWKSAADTIRLVESLLPNTAAGLRFVVLENGSNDESDAVLRRRFSEEPFADVVTYFASETNLGFCAGVNRAVDVALAANPKPEYLWFLNPDTYPGTHIVSRLVAVAVESGAGIVSARAGAPPDGFAGEGRWPLAYFTPGCFWKTKPVQGATWWPTFRYHGGCVLFRTSIVERLRAQPGGFLREPYFMYEDEWDTSLRARALGDRVVVAADTFVRHHSPGRDRLPGMAEARMYYRSRNAVSMGGRWVPLWMLPVAFPIHIARDLIWYCLLKRQPLGAYLWGLADGLRGRTGIWDRHPS